MHLGDFEAEGILRWVRWDPPYALCYRAREKILWGRGLRVDPSTISRWGQRYTPGLGQRCGTPLRTTQDSSRGDARYVPIKRHGTDLYWAVEAEGHTLDVRRSAQREGRTATQGFSKGLRASHVSWSRGLSVDKHAACLTL